MITRLAIPKRPVAALLVCMTWLAACAFLPGAAADSRDQKKDYALIFGTVWSPDHRPVPGVTVKIRRADKKKARWNLVSDRRGEFAQRLPAETADYVVWAEKKGAKQPLAQAKVHIELDERADIGLHLTE